MYKYNKKFFNQINTENKAYWAGFIAADGNIRKDFLKLRIELNIKDKHHLEKFRIDIEGDNPIKESIRPNNHSCYIDVNCKELCLSLNNLGITPNKSLTLDINFDLIPCELHKDFLRGYFDGDGSLNYYMRKGSEYKEWELSFIGTQIFLNKTLKILELEKKLFSCGNNYRFCIKSKKDIEKVLSFLYKDSTIYLDRKNEKKTFFQSSQRLPSDTQLNG